MVVVGLGRVGWQFHFRQAVASDRFDLQAVVDPLEERVDEAIAESGCRGYGSYVEMLDKEKPDLVALATPTTFHEEQTLQAISHGCHVILEKPMTTSLASADRMIRRCQGERQTNLRLPASPINRPDRNGAICPPIGQNGHPLLDQTKRLPIHAQKRLAESQEA